MQTMCPHSGVGEEFLARPLGYLMKTGVTLEQIFGPGRPGAAIFPGAEAGRGGHPCSKAPTNLVDFFNLNFLL